MMFPKKEHFYYLCEQKTWNHGRKRKVQDNIFG